MILSSFLLALAQLSDPRFRSVLWRGIGLTIALLGGDLCRSAVADRGADRRTDHLARRRANHLAG